MSDTHAMHRKMERFLSYNPDNEIRSDTGAVLDEKERALEIRRYNRNYHFEDSKEIGINRINWDKKTDKIFMCKSRGRK